MDTITQIDRAYDQGRRDAYLEIMRDMERSFRIAISEGSDKGAGGEAIAVLRQIIASLVTKLDQIA